jgi:hypothetical protein
MNGAFGAISADGARRFISIWASSQVLTAAARALLFRMIIGETAGLEDYGAQLGDAAATRVIEVHKRKAGPGHRILQERDRRCPRQAMLAAQMQKSADKTVASVSVVITAARPVAVVGKILEHQGRAAAPLARFGLLALV